MHSFYLTHEIQISENELSDITKRPGVRPTYDILCEAFLIKMFKLIPTSVRVNSAKKAAKAAFDSRVIRTVETLSRFATLCSRVHRRQAALRRATVKPAHIPSDEELAQYTALMRQQAAAAPVRKLFHLDDPRPWSSIVIDEQENEHKRLLSLSDEAFFAERQALLNAYRIARRDIRPVLDGWLAMSKLRNNAKRAEAARIAQIAQVWSEVVRSPTRRFAFLTQPRSN
jgi:hypothetical protein